MRNYHPLAVFHIVFMATPEALADADKPEPVTAIGTDDLRFTGPIIHYIPIYASTHSN